MINVKTVWFVIIVKIVKIVNCVRGVKIAMNVMIVKIVLIVNIVSFHKTYLISTMLSIIKNIKLKKNITKRSIL